jgi:dynein heavy chain
MSWGCSMTVLGVVPAGLRALKSVLVMAGSLKRGAPDMSEQLVLMRALRDMNLPKFIFDDVPLFLGLINDLFPGEHRCSEASPTRHLWLCGSVSGKRLLVRYTGHRPRLPLAPGMDCPRVRYPQFNDVVEADLADQGFKVLTEPSEQVGRLAQPVRPQPVHALSVGLCKRVCMKPGF